MVKLEDITMEVDMVEIMEMIMVITDAVTITEDQSSLTTMYVTLMPQS